MIFVLTETNLNDADARTLYRAPQQIIRADNIDEVSAALGELDRALDAGLHCAGYFSYELGYALEPRLNGLMPLDRALPLLWFGVFEAAGATNRDRHPAISRRTNKFNTPVKCVHTGVDRGGIRDEI